MGTCGMKILWPTLVIGERILLWVALVEIIGNQRDLLESVFQMLRWNRVSMSWAPAASCSLGHLNISLESEFATSCRIDNNKLLKKHFIRCFLCALVLSKFLLNSQGMSGQGVHCVLPLSPWTGMNFPSRPIWDEGTTTSDVRQAGHQLPGSSVAVPAVFPKGSICYCLHQSNHILCLWHTNTRAWLNLEKTFAFYVLPQLWPIRPWIGYAS